MSTKTERNQRARDAILARERAKRPLPPPEEPKKKRALPEPVVEEVVTTHSEPVEPVEIVNEIDVLGEGDQ